MPRMTRLPALPQLLERKISKTGQTRGADDDVIYQNRVNRCNTVLIPYNIWLENRAIRQMCDDFEKGYIVLINPTDYFALNNPDIELFEVGLTIGINCLVFYETRAEWNNHNPDLLGWHFANNRISPLGGQFVARVPATTATVDFAKIIRGYSDQSPKGAGIRLYEYASSTTINKCRLQLEAAYWLCSDAVEVVEQFGMTHENAILRKNSILTQCDNADLLNYQLLYEQRIIDADRNTVCPLCLKKLSGKGFLCRLAQAEGRVVPDLTVTEINLFHIEELKYGQFNHKPYNLGWGHHYCNIVAKDAGLDSTLAWLQEIIQRNIDAGYIAR